MELKCPKCRGDIVEQRQLFLRHVYRRFECENNHRHFRFPDDCRGFDSDIEARSAYPRLDKAIKKAWAEINVKPVAQECSFHRTRDPEEQAKAFGDKDFMAWLRRYEPDYKTELWDRNITAMYHAYLEGRNVTAKVG